MSKKAIHWSGVFPAVSTQFRSDYSLDLDATHAVMKNLVKDGVSGLVVCGSVGENTSLTTQEKLQIIEVAKDAAGGQIPVIAGVAEFTTAFAQKMAKEAERVGVDGIMVMPALVYSSKPHETAAHFRSVATATDLPIMVYNNPPIYKNDVTPDILATLADCDNIVCFKDSSGDTRRFIDLRNSVGDRFVLFAGLDDVVVESIAVGAEGWISGMSNAFPREGETLFRLAKQQRYEEAMALYRWFMPLLHLVQCIKLCEELRITRPLWWRLSRRRWRPDHSCLTLASMTFLCIPAPDAAGRRRGPFWPIAHQETALPLARLQGERARTSNQLRMFAGVLRRGMPSACVLIPRCLRASRCRARICASI
jgi:4-hydroxy-tetrahydrodipicolinate synthase